MLPSNSQGFRQTMLRHVMVLSVLFHSIGLYLKALALLVKLSSLAKLGRQTVMSVSRF